MALLLPSLTISPRPKLALLLPRSPTAGLRVRRSRLPKRARAAIEGATGLTSPPPELTWQIAVGALAGITPFVVAGIEFGKRIAAQKKCEVCGGSGLVLMKDKQYVRCPGCGGFLPWQSWKRFFTG